MEKKGYHHNNLRQALIEAGIQIINEDGYDNLSLRKAAVMCGVSHAAPKNHFHDKEEFYNAIKKYIAEGFAEYFKVAIDQNQDEKMLIRDMGIAYIQFFEDNPQYYRLFVDQNDISIHISEHAIEDSEYLPFQLFQENARKVIRKRNVPEEAIPRMILELWAIVNGLVALRVMKGFHYDGDWMAMVNQIIKGER